MYQQELNRLIPLLQRASELALEVYGRDFRWENKDDDAGPVTEADRLVNEFLVGELRRAFPGDAVIGEESADSVDLDSERLWIIDPVDGTKDFLRKNDEWSIMVGLSVGGRAQVGAVAQSALDRLYVGSPDEGAWLLQGSSRTRLQVRESAERAVLVNSRSHPDPVIDDIQAALGISEGYRHGSVGCKVAHISEQRADLYVNLSGKCHLWDVCGPEALLHAAGGALVQADGQPIHYGGTSTRVTAPFLATTQALLPAALKATEAVLATRR